jgi:hypothetical protein
VGGSCENKVTDYQKQAGIKNECAVSILKDITPRDRSIDRARRPRASKKECVAFCAASRCGWTKLDRGKLRQACGATVWADVRIVDAEAVDLVNTEGLDGVVIALITREVGVGASGCECAGEGEENCALSLKVVLRRGVLPVVRVLLAGGHELRDADAGLEGDGRDGVALLELGGHAGRCGGKGASYGCGRARCRSCCHYSVGRGGEAAAGDVSRCAGDEGVCRRGAERGDTRGGKGEHRHVAAGRQMVGLIYI